MKMTTIIGGIVTIMLSAGFAFHVPVVTSLWPWQDGALSYLFVGSILAAVAAAMLWIGLTEEWGALPAGSLNLFVIGALSGAYFFFLYGNGRTELLTAGILSVLVAAVNFGVFLWTRRIPLHAERLTPRFVRISFAIFTVALVAAGSALVFRIPVFPWALNPDSSVIFGIIFLGDAFYFLHGLLRPAWHNAKGQLLSFLAYDLVLILPFLKLFTSVAPERLFNLVVYVGVLVYSGGLAVYYLFISPQRAG